MPLDNISITDPSYILFLFLPLLPEAGWGFLFRCWRCGSLYSYEYRLQETHSCPGTEDGKRAVGKRRKDSQKDLDRRSLMRLNSTCHSVDGKTSLK